MGKFTYSAMSADGRETKGKIDANGEQEAIRILKLKGLFPTRVTPVVRPDQASGTSGPGGPRTQNRNAFWRPKIKTKPLGQITRQLATLLHAGMPLVRSFRLLQRQWLDASVRDELTSEQHRVLAWHMACCEHCIRRSAEPDLLAHVMGALSATHVPEPAFQTRIAAGFRRTTDTSKRLLRALSGRTCRIVVRVGFGTLLCFVLAVRSLNVRVFHDEFTLARALSAVWQVALCSPRYEQGLTRSAEPFSNQDLLLAAMHKLTTLYVDLVIWIVLLGVLGLLAIDACRRSRLAAH